MIGNLIFDNNKKSIEYIEKTEFEFDFVASSESIGGNETNSDTTTVIAIKQTSLLNRTNNTFRSEREGIELNISKSAIDDNGFTLFGEA